MGSNRRYTNTKLGGDTTMTDTILKQEDAVKCDNKETEVLENKQQESKSVSVTVTGFSLFADTLK